MMRRLAIAALVALATSAAAATKTPDDGFATFWKGFAAAAARNDRAALERAVQLGPELGDDGASFAKFYAGDLGPVIRRCLAHTKPTRADYADGFHGYDAFCSQTIYVFDKTAAGWKLSGISADD